MSFARPEALNSFHERNTTCALFKLPAELRNQIYEYVLVPNCKDTHDFLPDNHIPIDMRYPTKAAPPALLRTCRTVRSEAAKMHYSLVIFLFHSVYDLIDWLKAIGEEQHGMLRHIRFQFAHWNAKTQRLVALRLLQDIAGRLAAEGLTLPKNVLEVVLKMEKRVSQLFTVADLEAACEGAEGGREPAHIIPMI